MRNVHQYGQWDCWRQSLSTESRKLCGFLGEEFLHEVRIFRACCGEISNFHGNVYYIQYIYIDTWNSENPILIIYIHIYMFPGITFELLTLLIYRYLCSSQFCQHDQPPSTNDQGRPGGLTTTNAGRMCPVAGSLRRTEGWCLWFDQFIRCGTHTFAGYAAICNYGTTYAIKDME